MKTVVLNLPSSTERLASFFANYPSNCPTCEVFQATGVEGLEIPEWWGTLPEYYANTLSFIRLCDLVLDHGAPVTIYEDDCGFLDNYANNLNRFLEEVPADWTYLQIHPQHTCIGPYAPVQVSENVLRTRSCYCTVATVMTPASAAIIKEALQSEKWPCRHVSDHRISMKIYDGSLITYSPLNRICVHNAGISDITGKEKNRLLFEQYIYKNLNGVFVDRQEELNALAEENSQEPAVEDEQTTNE